MSEHIEVLSQWWEDAEQGVARKGDIVIWRNQRHRSGTYAYEVGSQDRDEVAALPDDLRILSRAPKPKPAWHDAVAVIAHIGGNELPRVLVARIDGAFVDGMTGHAYAADRLRDVTPLVEAKVTDEAVDRVLDVLHAWNDTYPAGLGTKLAAAALGLEAT